MNENAINKKYDHRLDLFDWMLAIDFDSVELKSSQQNDSQKRVIKLDISAIRTDVGD
ncbi:MAG: hypothetical protein ABSA75_02125 [Candidatus Bathyarchaeia archaeon]|jgi:hypothetical protein